MSLHRPLRAHTLAGFTAAAALGGLSLAEGFAQDPSFDPAPPGSADALVADDVFEDDVFDDATDDAGLPPLLGTADGDSAAVRLIRDGRVMAAGTLEAGGGFEAGAMPPGVYTVAGQSDGGVALFAYKIKEGKVTVDDGPLPLVAPASDWPLARSILARRFQLAPAPAGGVRPPSPAVGLPAPGPLAPAAAPMALRPIAAKRTAANRRAAGVQPGDVGRIEQYDTFGTLQPVPRAEVYLIRSGELVSTLEADGAGLVTLPGTLDAGLHTLVSIGIARNNTEPGASVIGLNVTAAGTRAVSDEQDKDEDARPLVRPVVLKPVALKKVVKQGPAFSVTQAPGSDVAAAIGGPPPGEPGFDEPVPPGFAAGGPAGFGGGAGGGAGGGGFGGALLPALIGAGIGAGIAAAIDDDDDDDEGDEIAPEFDVDRTPPAASPAGASSAPPSGGGEGEED